MKNIWMVFGCLAFWMPGAAQTKEIVVGSKAFTEGYILGEIAAQILEREEGAGVQRKLGMGSSGVLFEALRNGAIDLYPDYTGTIAESLLKKPHLKSESVLHEILAEQNLVASARLGFNNTYALAVRESFAEKHDLRKISDLTRVASVVRAAFSYEFMDRTDGYRGLIERYALKFGPSVRRMEHSLTYEAIAADQMDLIEVYSTDAKIRKLNLRVLEDDRKYFPSYYAVFLATQKFVEEHPRAWVALNDLAGRFDEAEMISLNAQADLEKKSFDQIASDWLGIQKESNHASEVMAVVGQRTKEHLILVFAALLISIAIGVPFGVFATLQPGVGRAILLLSGVFQTIPALALLCFLIPVLGVGFRPALAALCLYALLPIVLNTYVGIRGIDPQHIETARAMGLRESTLYRKIILPLAGPSILAGIKTSAIVSIGNATLAALIGAGGYGAPIISGLALNDIPTILTGAVPAALLSLVVYGLFEVLTRFFGKGAP
jgi:osmoprotectant transport system permease protein